jgi:transposase
VLETCAEPLDSVNWLSALLLVTRQCGGQPARLAAMGWQEFTDAVRAGVPGWGGQRVCRRIAVRVFDALTDQEGAVAWSRRGMLRRVAGELAGLQCIRAQLRAVEADMTAVLDEPGLSRLGDIPGLSPAGAAAILAEAGGPHRYDSSSSLVKHAGMSPSDNASGSFPGGAHISRRGRPGLRLAVWRAVWPMLQFNPVMAAKYQAMIQAADTAAAQAAAGTRQASAAAAAARAQRARARVACAAALLRWIYSMTVHGTSWDAAVAAGEAAQHAPRRVEAA